MFVALIFFVPRFQSFGATFVVADTQSAQREKY